jgi:glycosyltransferase involved in cell wall biosynthesis
VRREGRRRPVFSVLLTVSRAAAKDCCFMRKISVVIPVYNIEFYLPRCLDSLLACDLRDTEILLIDDGATDGSGAICDRYAGKHEAIAVFHTPNRGPSDARNWGLEQANGEWILFIDGDDTVIPERFGAFTRQLRDSGNSMDVMLNDYIVFDANTGKSHTSRQINGGAQDLPQVLSERGHIWNIVRYAYRRAFLERHELRFKAGYLAEDFEFTMRLLVIPNLRIGFVHIPYYVYNLNRGGSTMTANPVRLLECVTRIVRTHYSILKERTDGISRLLRRKLLREYLYMLPRVYQFEGRERIAATELFNKEGSPLPVNAKFIAPFALFAKNAWGLYKKIR